jgi:hypothetical protein
MFHARKGQAWHAQRTIKPKEQRTSPDGIQHHSAAEMRRWCELLSLQERGHVKDLQRQVRFPLRIDEERAVLTPTGRIAVYTPDFVYRRLTNGEWQLVIEDKKGHMDITSALRIAIFEAIYSVKVHIT